MATRSTAAERAEWLEDMRAQLPPGSTVHTVLRHVSRSGMSRAIDLYALTCEPDGTVGRYWLSYRAAAVMGWTFSNRYEALIASGAAWTWDFTLSTRCRAVSTLTGSIAPASAARRATIATGCRARSSRLPKLRA
jgi:hypothetical protein